MELEEQKLIKVKLKLVQPAIMCQGRTPVTCHYRGKIIKTIVNYKLIEFKSHGELVKVVFYFDECVTPNWEDLKIIK
jgi:hypothetical protein